jgi:hypothetical protein
MLTEIAQSSETERIVRALKAFTPRGAVKILTEPDTPIFMKTWALARLLAWAVLEQRPGKRRALRTRSAKQVGRLTIAGLLHRRIGEYGARQEDETLELMFAVFTTTGSFGALVEGRGSRALLSAAKHASRELSYVYQIVSFLCRHKKYIGGGVKFDIETAKVFVAKNMHEGDGTYRVSKISKIWEKYKQAAPFIFAFYGYFSSPLKRTKSPGQIIDFLEKLASKQPRLTAIIGRAAYAADIIDQRARGVRLGDFKCLARVEPPLRPFDQEERAIYNSIDRTAPIP